MNSDAGSQNVELVPRGASSKLNTAITGKVKSHKARSDLENGIGVQWSMEQTEMSLSKS